MHHTPLPSGTPAITATSPVRSTSASPPSKTAATYSAPPSTGTWSLPSKMKTTRSNSPTCSMEAEVVEDGTELEADATFQVASPTV